MPPPSAPLPPADAPGGPAAPPLLRAVAAIARQAADIVMAVYAAAPAPARTKADASPVTEADERAEAHIVPALQALLPGVPVVAEEAVAAGRVPAFGEKAPRCFWLVDPLDGTREFLARNGEFTVNIALVEQGRAVLGVVLAPAAVPGGVLYAGADALGAWCAEGVQAWQPIAARRPPAQGLTLLSSRSHGDDAALQAFLGGYLRGRRIACHRTAGSSLKLGLLARGQADLYPRLGRTMEWDIAAGHAVLAAAGGQVLTLQGQPLRYGKPGFENPHFVAVGQAEA
jgi:3'(2'), 5'-bisphosphate nucleotidase